MNISIISTKESVPKMYRTTIVRTISITLTILNVKEKLQLPS